MLLNMATLPRFLEAPASHFFLFGPRGTGKTTWLRSRFPNALWVDLLAPDQHRSYSARPERLRELVRASSADTLVIDEVQRAPQLLQAVHQMIEGGIPLRIVLTGSSARKLKQTGVDLLAGRAVLRELHPFMAAELGDQFNFERALVEGMVPLIWDALVPADTLASYVALYVREEVQAEGLVRNLGAFHRFLEAISFSHAAVLNLSEVARECQVSRKTVEGYLGILEDLLLAFQVPVFTRRARRKLAAHPKFFWMDSGVFRSLRPSGPLDRSEELAGAALEGLIAQHLRGWAAYTEGDFRLAFWRTRSGLEVDLVLYGEQTFHAIEVKHSATVRARDLRPLKAFREDYPEAELRLLYRGEEALEIDGIRCLPCANFLRAVVPGRPLP